MILKNSRNIQQGTFTLTIHGCIIINPKAVTIAFMATNRYHRIYAVTTKTGVLPKHLHTQQNPGGQHQQTSALALDRLTTEAISAKAGFMYPCSGQ